MASIELSDSGLVAAVAVTAYDEHGRPQEKAIAAERPLTIYLDKHEIVTLMTLGTQPELLTLGYLRNQGLVDDIAEIKAVQVDWEAEAAAVVTRHGTDPDILAMLGQRTVTTGCGQGTVYGRLQERLNQIRLHAPPVRQSVIYRLLANLKQYNEVYKQAGAVHGCALCSKEGEILFFCEDVGRHNAVDAIAGYMWLHGIGGGDKIFYTTGRLTSEMSIKAAQMRIPVLLSRSGITQMGLEMAHQAGITLIARARGHHFLVYCGQDRVLYDAPPRRSA